MEGEGRGGFCLTFWGLDCSVLVVPYFDGFVPACGGDEGLPQADVHGHDGSCVEVQADGLEAGTYCVFKGLEADLALQHYSV